MSRKINDGKGRLGGRSKGTPNKITRPLKEWIKNLLEDNREQIERDIKELSAKDRLAMFEKLLQYVIPKQKTELEITNVQAKEKEAKEDLSYIPDDLLFKVADCIQEGRRQKKQDVREKGV